MRIQQKILNHFAMILVISIAFATTAFVYVSIEQNRLRKLWLDLKTNEESIFKKLIELKSESLTTLATDYTYWDEMVNFVLKPSENAKWAEEMLSTAFDVYHCDLIFVYDFKGKPVYEKNKINADDQVLLAIIPENIPALFRDSMFVHFFAKSPKGLMEIRGARIHATNDPNRVKEHFGYFFTGRLWDKDFLDEISLLTGGVLDLLPINQKKISSASETFVSFSYILKGLNQQPVAELRVRIYSPAIQNSIIFSRQILFLFLFSGVFVLALISTFFIRWVSMPLSAISKTLMQEDTQFINGLTKTRTEFGELARLIQQFFTQKKTLMKEIADRKKAVLDLKETQSQLLHTEKLASIGQLSTGIAHEINIPISDISSNIDALTEHLKVYNQLVEYIPVFMNMLESRNIKEAVLFRQHLENISKNSDMLHIRQDVTKLLNDSYQDLERIKVITRNLRSLGHPDEKEKSLIRIEDCIEGVLAIVQNEIKYKANLIKNYSETKEILGFPQQLGQVFINLIILASRGINQNGTVVIKSFMVDGYVCASISGTGSGTPKENLIGLSLAEKDSEISTSIGLKVCCDIVGKHRGKLTVNSDSDQGTTFTVFLPMRKKEFFPGQTTDE